MAITRSRSISPRSLGISGIANATLDVGEKPQIFLQYDAYAEKGSSVSTSQFKLSVGALGALSASPLAVTFTLASATVKVDAINCHSDGTADVTLKANTSAGAVGVRRRSCRLFRSVGIGRGTERQFRVRRYCDANLQAGALQPCAADGTARSDNEDHAEAG